MEQEHQNKSNRKRTATDENQDGSQKKRRKTEKKIAVDIVEEQENSSNPVTVELEVAVARDDLNIEIIPPEQRSAILEEVQKYIESERDEMLTKSDANENKEEKREEKWDIVYLALKKVANILNKRSFLTSPLPIYNEAVEVFRTNRLRCGHQRGEESRLLDIFRDDEVPGNDSFRFNNPEALREGNLELERLMLPQHTGTIAKELFQFDERFPVDPEAAQTGRPAFVEPEAAQIGRPAPASQLAGGFVNYGEWPLQEDVEFQIDTWTTKKVIEFVGKILHDDELLLQTQETLRKEAIREEAFLDDRRRPEFLQYVEIPWGHADKIRRELTVVNSYWASRNSDIIY